MWAESHRRKLAISARPLVSADASGRLQLLGSGAGGRLVKEPALFDVGGVPPAQTGIPVDRLVARERSASARHQTRGQRLHGRVMALATIVPLLLLLLSGVHSVAPQGDGFGALTQIFAPYLFLALVPLLPLVGAARGYPLKLAVLACLLVFCVRFGSSLVSIPVIATPNAKQISALTWNLELTNRELGAIRGVLDRSLADIVGLQELTYEQAQVIEIGRAHV